MKSMTEAARELEEKMLSKLVRQTHLQQQALPVSQAHNVGAGCKRHVSTQLQDEKSAGLRILCTFARNDPSPRIVEQGAAASAGNL